MLRRDSASLTLLRVEDATSAAEAAEVPAAVNCAVPVGVDDEDAERLDASEWLEVEGAEGGSGLIFGLALATFVCAATAAAESSEAARSAALAATSWEKFFTLDVVSLFELSPCSTTILSPRLAFEAAAAEGLKI